MQVTTDGGSTWTNVSATSNYPSRMDGHEIGGGGNPNPTHFSATWTLTPPQTNINGIRLIGEATYEYRRLDDKVGICIYKPNVWQGRTDVILRAIFDFEQSLHSMRMITPTR